MQLWNIDKYFLTETREQELWKHCYFVFDSSALLDFYYLTSKTQNEIFSDIFEKIRSRLWIPSHVEYEYLKNREKTLLKPIEEKYNKLKTDNLKIFKDEIQKIKNQLKGFSQMVSKEDTHPHINLEITHDFQSKFNTFEADYINFEKQVLDEFKTREQEIGSFLDNDTVLENLNKYLNVGEEFDFKKIMEIVGEGEIRFRSKIPPGYEDGIGPKAKDGFQRYGDLIIWKQIIEFAKRNGKPIVLIINDVKPDWCYSIRRSNEHRIERPREELIKEINDIAGVEFWMYTFAQFLFTSKNLLNTNITDEAIQDATIIYPNIKTLLLVDDDLILRSIVVSQLEHLPINIIQASNAEEAYNIFMNEKIDICILDTFLPGQSGWDLLEKLQKEDNRPEGLKILLLAAKPHTEDDFVKAFNLGVNDYITKPFSLVDLEMRIQRMLRDIEDINKQRYYAP